MKEKTIMPATEPPHPPLPAPTHQPQRILLADDDADIRRLCARVLIRAGYQVDAAEDGAAGWEALQAKQYDLLITDHDMPKVTGMELIKKVKAARMVLPVIMATGNWPGLEFSQEPSLHPTAKLLKPYTGAELLGTVKMVLGELEKIAPPAIYTDCQK